MTRLATLSLGLLLASAALASAAVAPRTLLLKGAQVGPGYKVLPFRGSDLTEATLDMCNLKFPSERMRIARAKLVYGSSDPGAPYVANEVVTYKAGGASQALRDVVGSVKRCPKGVVRTPDAEVTSRVRIVSLKGAFLPGTVVISVSVQGIAFGKPVTREGLGVYQRRGDVLSAVLTYDTTLAARSAAARRAGAASAKKLRAGV